MAFYNEITRGQILLSQAQEIAKELSVRAIPVDFRSVVLSLVAYRLYSEVFIGLLEEEEHQARKFRRPLERFQYSLNYASLRDANIDQEYIDTIREKIGYFILPSQIFRSTFCKARRNLHKFILDGKRVSVDKLVHNFFTIVETDEPLFSLFFEDEAFFGASPKARSIYMTKLFHFVDHMDYDVVEQMLPLLAAPR